jgi:fibronectin type 3 domain-containing protein
MIGRDMEGGQYFNGIIDEVYVYSRALTAVEILENYQEIIPTVPLNMMADSGDGYVDLTWDPPSDDGASAVTNYLIYRGDTSGNGTELITTGNVLSHKDTDVMNGATYFYTVSAINTFGQGPTSNEVSDKPMSVPSAPRNLITVAGNGHVNLSWNSPANDGGAAIVNYKIYRGTSSDGQTLLGTIGNLLTYTDTDVANDFTYYYKVSAVNSIGESQLSFESSVTPTADPGGPGDPDDEGHETDPYLLPILAAVIALAVIGYVAYALMRKPKEPQTPEYQERPRSPPEYKY